MPNWMHRLLIVLLLLLGTGTLTAQNTSLYNLPDAFAAPVYRSSTLAITRAGRVLTANTLTDTVMLFGLDGAAEATFDIGANPRSVAITPDNLQMLALSESQLVVIDLTTNTISNRIFIEGGYRFVTNGEQVHISRRQAGEVVTIDLATGRTLRRISTPANPAGLAWWGDFLYITHYWTGDLSLIFLPAGDVVRTVSLDADASHAATIEINPRQGVAYLPQSISNTAAPVPDNRIIPVVQIVDLGTLQRRDTINLITADRYVQLPLDARLNQTRTQLYVAHAGSGDISVIDLDSRVATAHITTGTGTNGLLFDAGFTNIIAHNAVEATVTRHDTRFFIQQDVISVGQVDPAEQLGAQVFYTQGCVACHAHGESDGRAWNDETTPVLQNRSASQLETVLTHHQQLFDIAPSISDIERAALREYLQALDED